MLTSSSLASHFGRKRTQQIHFCLCCREFFFFRFSFLLVKLFARNAGAAFFYMNAINCGILQAKKRIFSDEQQCQCNFSSSFVNASIVFFHSPSLLLLVFLLCACCRDSIFVFFVASFNRTHNEFTMVVESMMRLNIKLLVFFSRALTLTISKALIFDQFNWNRAFIAVLSSIYVRISLCLYPHRVYLHLLNINASFSRRMKKIAHCN